MRHAWGVLLLPLLLEGCFGGDGRSPVYVQTTLLRMELPERPSRVVGLTAGHSGRRAFVLLTRDQVTQAPSATATVATDEAPSYVDDSTFIGRAELTLWKRLTFGYSNRESGPRLVHFRFYLAGPERERAKSGDVSLALTGAFGRDRRTFYGQVYDFNTSTMLNYETRLARQQQDLGLILGLRLGKPFLLYGGPYYQRSRFVFDHDRPSTPTSHGEGESQARGMHLGLALLAGRFSTIMAEWSRAQVTSPGDRQTLGTTGLTYQMNF